MSKIIFDIGISLDGFFAGDNRSPSNPIGDNGPVIHNWLYKQKAFWKNINMEGGEEPAAVAAGFLFVGKTVGSKTRYPFIFQCIAFEDSLLFTS
jgi:hypothetical protein